MKAREVIGALIVAGILLAVTATYISYSDQVTAMRDRGVWTADLEGKVYLVSGIVYPVITGFRADFNAYPDTPTYMEYLEDIFNDDTTGQVVMSENDTFVSLRIVVTVNCENLVEQTIMDESVRIAFPWAGGAISESGEIASFSYDLGPYVAYHERSPYELTATATIEGESSVDKTFYLTIPDLSIGPDLFPTEGWG